MRPETDYYVVLQVDLRAEKEVIEAAYRRLAAKYHPDVNHSPQAVQRMTLINAAYEVLSDPEKRNAYDLSRARYRRQGGPATDAPGSGRPWWLLLAALAVFVVAFRFSPRLLFVLVPLFLIVWALWGRKATRPK